MRSYAPRGQPPVLHVPLTRDHLAVISAITPHGQLLVQIQAGAFTGGAVVRFLRHLREHLGACLLIIWDGIAIHHDKTVTAFLAAEGGQMHLEQLPGYAPDLNPAEGVWDQLKNVELRNIACHDLGELRYQLRLAIARLRHKPELVRSFVKHYGY